MECRYVMAFSNHAEERLKERYANVKVNQLLVTRVSDVSQDVAARCFNSCAPEAREMLISGSRELKSFNGLGIVAVVCMSNLCVVTVFPNTNKDTVSPIIMKKDYVELLRDKIRWANELPKSVRSNSVVGSEMHRIGIEISKIKPKGDRLLAHMEKVNREYNALKSFVVAEFGWDAMQKFIDNQAKSDE